MQELVNLLNSRGMRSIRGGKITLNIMNHLLKTAVTWENTAIVM